MMKRVLIAVIAALTSASMLWATSPSGQTSTVIGPPAIMDPLKVGRQTNAWQIQIEAMRGLRVVTASVLFAPHGYSGWHTHPGPVIITVKEGTMTFYDEDCTANVFIAGQGFIETGAHPHFARNETDSPATTVVTYLTPPSATTTRIDTPQPPTCMLP
jgi:quercetin dioxygenase-like cupin family protein